MSLIIFFLHTELLLKANITELDSNRNSRHNLCSSHTFVHFASGYFQGFHILDNPDSSCSIIFKTLAHPDSQSIICKTQDSNKSSQVIGTSMLRSIICKTWAYQDFDQSLQNLGISGLWSIIYKIWAYPDFDQSFARLWHNRISINHSQDSGQSLARLAYSTHNRHMFRYAQVLQMIDQILDMLKSCEQLIGVLICLLKSCEWLIGRPSLVNDWLCLNWYAQVLRMIIRRTDMPMTWDDLLESWHAQVLRMIDQSPDTPVTDS